MHECMHFIIIYANDRRNAKVLTFPGALVLFVFTWKNTRKNVVKLWYSILLLVSIATIVLLLHFLI